MIHFLQHIFNQISQVQLISVAHAQEASASSGSGNVATLFGLNWNLFIAQLINFAIIFFILWKWVFGPIGKKLEERTSKIEKSLQQAKEIEEKHKQAEADRLSEIERARKEANLIVDKAQAAANQTKDQILAEAKQSAEKLIAQTKQQLADEKNKLLREVKEEAANLVVMATEKLLREKLDPKKDQDIIKESLKNL